MTGTIQSFRREGILWTAESVTEESSDDGTYVWTKVIARQSVFDGGLYNKHPRMFIFGKRQMKDFSGNPLPEPRYIEN
jgi:hypothetical protein